MLLKAFSIEVDKCAPITDKNLRFINKMLLSKMKKNFLPFSFSDLILENKKNSS